VIPALVAVAAALVMEPIAAALHRWVMHKRGWAWHRSHHAPKRGLVEANDLFPLVFAAFTVAVMATGTWIPALRPLFWIGIGVSAYGAAYIVVHDLCIHGRVGRAVGSICYLRWVRAAHHLHHLYGRAPYGFLLPVVPKELGLLSESPPAEGGQWTNEVATVQSLRPRETRARRVKTS